VFLDHSLNLPRGDGGAVLLFVQNPEFHLTPADMRATKEFDSRLLKTRHFPSPCLMRSLTCILQSREVERVVLFLPFVEALATDSKVATGECRILCLPEMIHPGKTLFRLFTKGWYASEACCSLREHK
jgi:hypothetical protein